MKSFKYFILFFLVFSLTSGRTIITKTGKEVWPCKQDVDQYCSSVKFGSKADKEKCLQSHQSSLSDVCKNYREGKEKKTEAVKSACENDFATFCQGVTGSKVTCLKKHMDQLSKECADQMSFVQRKSGLRRHAKCRYDSNKYCSAAKTSAEIKSCLMENLDNLTASCAQTLQVKDSRKAAKQTCADDIPKFCGDKNAKRHVVYTCLIAHMDSVSEGCKAELSKLDGLTNPKDDEEEEEEETVPEEVVPDDASVDDGGTEGGGTEGGGTE